MQPTNNLNRCVCFLWVCVSQCVCLRERERESVCVCVCTHIHMQRRYFLFFLFWYILAKSFHFFCRCVFLDCSLFSFQRRNPPGVLSPPIQDCFQECRNNDEELVVPNSQEEYDCIFSSGISHSNHPVWVAINDTVENLYDLYTGLPVANYASGTPVSMVANPPGRHGTFQFMAASGNDPNCVYLHAEIYVASACDAALPSPPPTCLCGRGKRKV